MNGLTQYGLATITKKIYIIYRTFCFVHVIVMANQTTLEKNPVTIESIAFFFSVNCSFNSTLSSWIKIS